MSDQPDPEYRNLSPCLAVVRGSLPRTLAKQQSKDLIQREAHSLVLVATKDGIPVNHFDWWADLRRGRLRVWGGLLRFVDALIAKGHPERLVQMLPQLLSSYISDQYPQHPDPQGGSRTRAA